MLFRWLKPLIVNIGKVVMSTATDKPLGDFLNYLDNRLELKNIALDKTDFANDDSYRIRILLKEERAEFDVIRRALLEISKK